MTNPYPFKKMLNIGKVGEERFLADFPNATDVRDDKFYQKQDIDFVMDGQTYEVKTDTQPTANVFLEVEAHGKPGAVFASRAMWWVYYRVPAKQCVIFHLPGLQRWLVQNATKYPEKIVQGGKARGFAIPLADLDGFPFVKVLHDDEK